MQKVIRRRPPGSGFVNRIAALIVVVPALFSVASCAPHPGAGDWRATGDAKFVRLAVHFNGRAELYMAGGASEEYRCFWGGDSRQSIALECSAVGPADSTRRFVLNVTGDREAALLSGREIIGRYRKQIEPPK